ncbi:MAG: hypothetical protein ACRD1Y_14170, partial [Terriglobales bacterium]
MSWRFCSTPLAVILFAAALAAAPKPAAPKPAAAPPSILAVVHADRAGRPVSRYEYGMFIENLGPLVYRTLWAEMLDDRKFYVPIQPEPP